jgi:hypothetical protein
MPTSRITAPILVLAGLAAGLWIGLSRSAEAQAPGGPVTINAADHAGLQAAFDALPAEGGVVRIPPGNYDITEPLVISKPETRVEGSGAATHIRNHNEQGKPALILQHPKREAARTSAERGESFLWRVQLADFRISGNPKSGDGVYASGINEIYVHGMSIDHHGGHGLNCVDCYEDPRINDSIFTYNAQAGVNIQGGHDIVVNGNQFEENQDALRCIDSFNLCMNANNIDDHLRHGIVVENTYGSVLSGNMIEECTGTAIVLDRDVYGVTIGSNVIAHNQGGGVDVRDAWGSSISANTFTIMPNPAVRVGPNSGRIAITGNAFSNSHIGPETRRQEDYEAKWPRKVYASGIELEGTTDIVISGNLFAGLIEEAVRTKGRCLRIALSGNVASDLGRKRGEKLPAFNMSGAQEISAGLNATEKGFEGGLR